MTITLPQQNIKMDVPTGIDPVWYGKLQALTAELNALNNTLGGLLPPGTSWTTFTPTVTASSGVFTTVSATGSYQQLGKLVAVTCTIGITTVGTASGNIILPLPVITAKRAAVLTAFLTNTGEMGSGNIAASGSAAFIIKYNGTTLIGAGNVITVTGTYEAT